MIDSYSLKKLIQLRNENKHNTIAALPIVIEILIDLTIEVNELKKRLRPTEEMGKPYIDGEER